MRRLSRKRSNKYLTCSSTSSDNRFNPWKNRPPWQVWAHFLAKPSPKLESQLSSCLDNPLHRLMCTLVPQLSTSMEIVMWVSFTLQFWLSHCVSMYICLWRMLLIYKYEAQVYAVPECLVLRNWLHSEWVWALLYFARWWWHHGF